MLILAVLVQSPKSGMAANFGAANQTMGVRQTTDFLEKFTWAMVAAIVFFSLLSTTALPGRVVEGEEKDVAAENTEALNEVYGEQAPAPQQITMEPNVINLPAEGVENTEVSEPKTNEPVIEELVVEEPVVEEPVSEPETNEPVQE